MRQALGLAQGQLASSPALPHRVCDDRSMRYVACRTWVSALRAVGDVSALVKLVDLNRLIKY
jgi:hypothetical protein